MHNRKFFRVRWVGCLELGHFVKDSVKNTRKKGSAGKHFGVFSAEFFWAYWYMYRDQDFHKSIGECTIRQKDRQKLKLYLAAF